MPRFAANLTMLFTEVPFLERFAAARAGGVPRGRVRLAVRAPGRGGRRGGARRRASRWCSSTCRRATGRGATAAWPAIPRAPAEFRDGRRRAALEYARALGCPRLHAMAGIRPPGVAEAALRATYLESLRFAGSALAAHGLTLLVEGINARDMPGYYLADVARRRSRSWTRRRVPNLHYQYDVLPHADHGGRPRPDARAPAPAHRPRADRRRARAARARHRRDRTSASSSGTSTGSATAASSAASTGRSRGRRRGSPG